MQEFEQPRWYRRTGARVAVAAGLAAGVGVVAIGLGSGASANVDPEQAVQDAAERLTDVPTSVTITGPEDGSVTLSRTADAAGVSMDSAQGDLAAALAGERLYLRVDAPQTGMPLGLLGSLPSISALLEGEWVSVDVSEDSEVLAALRDAAQVEDTDAVRAAAEQLQSALTAIGEDLRDPMARALQDSTAVERIGEGSYRVTLDRAAAAAELDPALRSAFDQALAAMDDFAAAVPDGAAMWAERRAELVAAFDAQLAESDAPATMDVWIADGRFTKIVVENATLTFTDEASVEVPDDAVSMDSDLQTVLPFLQNLQLPGKA